MKSLRSSLILDGGKLAGSEFHRAVVLICDHEAAGAFGLILNRPSDTTVGDAIAAPLPDSLKELPLFLGGPVQPETLSFLIREPGTPDANVMTDLRLGRSLDELVEPGGNCIPAAQVKFFAGYAGWGPGQLDEEMKRSDWLVHPATLDVVFHLKPQELWKIILRNMGSEYRLLADEPEDLSWN